MLLNSFSVDKQHAWTNIMETFAQKFLKIYDRKIMSGEITFSQSGIKKNDFTRLCIDKDFVLAKEDLELVCDKMGLTHDEMSELLKFTEK